jgi:hypothetical protein
MSDKIPLVVFLLAAGLLLSFLIPPFQNPDEPQHFGGALIYTYGKTHQAEIEAEILALMQRNNWQKYIGLSTPSRIPRSFRETPYLNFSDFHATFANLTLYHRLLGGILKLFPGWNLEQLYRVSRLLSLLFAAGSVLAFTSAFRRLALLISPLFRLGPFLILLLPQFVLLSIAVNPDVLSIFLGALYFQVVVSVFQRGLKIGTGAALIVIPVLGLAIDKPCFFLTAATLLLPFFLTARPKILSRLTAAAALGSGFLLLAAWITWLAPAVTANSLALIIDVFTGPSAGPVHLIPAPAFLAHYFSWLFDSLLLKFGWMAFGPGPIATWIWRGLLLFALAGLISIFACRGKRARRRDSIRLDRGARRMTGFMLAALVFQIAGLWLYQGTRGLLPQGRYLFPALIPLVYLLLLGLHTAAGRTKAGAGKNAVAAVLLALWFFFGIAVWEFLVPVFHLAVQSPFPGT